MGVFDDIGKTLAVIYAPILLGTAGAETAVNVIQIKEQAREARREARFEAGQILSSAEANVIASRERARRLVSAQQAEFGGSGFAAGGTQDLVIGQTLLDAFIEQELIETNALREAQFLIKRGRKASKAATLAIIGQGFSFGAKALQAASALKDV